MLLVKHTDIKILYCGYITKHPHFYLNTKKNHFPIIKVSINKKFKN